MGTGSSMTKIDITNEFYLEAFQTQFLKADGLDLEKEELQTSKTLKKLNNFIFEEEIIEHADESGPVKPWLENVIAPNLAIEENISYPNYNLKIEHVYGFKTENSRKNIFFYKPDQIIYSVSSICIIQNLDDNTQRLFGGFPLKEQKECHDNIITAIDFLNNEVGMVATGQCGLVPKILVWSPVDTEVVYARFEQPRESKEVSALCFDKTGHYLASFGKDKNNSYYIFDLRKNELMWEQPTGEKDFLLDITFNKYISRDDDNEELLLVGVNKIIISNPKDHFDRNLYINRQKIGIFTSCCYVSKNRFLVGGSTGKVSFYLDREKTHQKHLSNGSIQNIAYKKQLSKIFVTDSLYKVYIIEDTLFTLRDSFTLKSVVKSIDVNDDFQMVLGLKNGDIVLKHWEDKTKYEEVYLKSHSEGSIGGMAFVPEYKLITSGEDNKILLWNLRSKKCESSGTINQLVKNNTNQNIEEYYIVGERNKSQCLAYHSSYEHVAVGINDGTISIRRNPKDLDKKVLPDISLVEAPIVNLDYTEYGDALLVMAENNDFFVLNVNDNYKKQKRIRLESYIKSFDIDEQAKYMRCCMNNNKFNFYNLELKTGNFSVDPNDEDLRKASWKNNKCKFSYTMQGIFQGSTNPNYISVVCKANNKNLLAAGDDDFLLNLGNYPCITENPKLKKYRGHSGVIKKIIWNSNDNLIMTIAENDKAIIVWSVEEEHK